MRRVIVGMSGASGALYGQKVLELLRDLPDVETHLILSDAARATIRHELEIEPEELHALATRVHDNADIAAGPASGSFRSAGMIIAPCSVRTLSAIAYGQTGSLMVRAADVALKERRRLVLMVRETPLHVGHLKAMLAASEAGAIVAPPVPALYARPTSIADMATQTAARCLDVLGFDCRELRRWQDD